MDTIKHRMLRINGINMHIAEKGEGPVILFIHGFPELWYSWRHQILNLSARGFHAVALDMRGYGDTDVPASVESYTIFHLVGDIVALIDALRQEKVFVVGHDWGAIVAWNLCLFRPDRVKALVNLSVPFSPRDPFKKPIDTIREIYGENHYICRFQDIGKAESEFSRLSTANIVKKFLIYRKPSPLILAKNTPLGGSPDARVSLPPWMSEDDLNYYAKKFEKTGFTGGLNYYRNMDKNWELTTAWTELQVKIPVKFVIGDLDLTYHSFGGQDFIHNGGFRKYVPFLQDLVVIEGAGHFINQERPGEINDHIFDFIHKFLLPS